MLNLNQLREKILAGEEIPDEVLRQSVIQMRQTQQELVEKSAQRKAKKNITSVAEQEASFQAAFGHLGKTE